MTQANQPIGVFDSGIGGLSILKALLACLPHERFAYFADTAYNPYGEKSEAFVLERTCFVARELVAQQHIKALVVACNTATAAAIHCLRAEFPELPIVGVEPALKPAALITRTGQVGVLATRGTLQSAKFAQLLASVKAHWQADPAHAAQELRFVCTACDGLAERIERLAQASGRFAVASELKAQSEMLVKNTGVFGIDCGELDTLVLGCTHYPLIRPIFSQAVGNRIQILDNAWPVARHTAQLLRSAGALNAEPARHALTPSPVTWLSSAPVEGLQQAAQFWLGDELPRVESR
jgi:glutamate racemase